MAVSVGIMSRQLDTTGCAVPSSSLGVSLVIRWPSRWLMVSGKCLSVVSSVTRLGRQQLGFGETGLTTIEVTL